MKTPPVAGNRPAIAGKGAVQAGHRFSHTPEQLNQIAHDMVAHARRQGASASATDVSDGFGQTVTVRQGEVETIEYNRDKGVSITVYLGQRRGNASTSDFSAQALRDTVDAALAIARHTAADECAGLPDEDALATATADLDLFHPWYIEVDQAIALARECEQAALARDKRISNSEGATVHVLESQFVYANSLGFTGGYPASRHSVSCAVIAGKGEGMQRDYWYSEARNAAEMLKVEEIGRITAERALRRLNARKLGTMQVPVLYEAPVAASLLGHFVGAVSGSSLYRKSSFLLDRMGQQVFSDIIHIEDVPDIPRGLASCPFDDEGVATRRRTVVDNGVLQGYFLGSYSARKLGMKTTGNAGGTHNLILRPGERDFDGLLKLMGRGLVVTELLGQGVNHVTGDYSRGVAGFWVENGEIQYPVEEITVAGNLKDMYRNIVAVGNDVLIQGSRQCGSILVDGMTVAGR
jgi:PmbA protein